MSLFYKNSLTFSITKQRKARRNRARSGHKDNGKENGTVSHDDAPHPEGNEIGQSNFMAAIHDASLTRNEENTSDAV